MKKFLKSCTTALAAMLFTACGVDPSVMGDDKVIQTECSGDDCDDKVMIQTKFGIKPGALIDGGTCTGEGDDAPCVTAYEKNKAEHQYDHACLPDDPEPQCKSAGGVWGCYMYTLDQCPTVQGCTTNAQCNDGKDCTQDSCDIDTGECNHTPTFGACSDGNACTVGDQCGDTGECVSGAPMECTDDKPCTDDACVDGECVYTPDDENECTDGQWCTDDACVDGECSVVPHVCAADDNACTDEVCNEETDTCDVVNDDTNTCDDGASCTADMCVGGFCVTHDWNDAACDNANPCTGEAEWCEPGFWSEDSDFTLDEVTGCVTFWLTPGDPCGKNMSCQMDMDAGTLMCLEDALPM